MTLAEQINHMSKLTQQIPASPVRVAYAASGMHVSAALITDPRVIIEHAVYWGAVSTEAEGHYLVGILNSPSLTELVRPLMSYGKDERHIDKHVWKLPIPAYDPADELHREISELAQCLTDEIAGQTFRSTNFVTTRRDLRAHVAASETGKRLDDLVKILLNADLDDATLVPPEPATEVQPPIWLIRTTSVPLPPLRADVEIDVDCEFDETGTVYLWGALVTDAENHDGTFHVFGSSDTTLDEHSLAVSFQTWLSNLIEQAARDGKAVRWYHYGRTEASHLRRILGTDAESLLESAIDVLSDVIRPNYYAATGYSLKQVGPGAGAAWRTAAATGADTYSWLSRARNGDPDAWNQLVEYNQDDTLALRAVRRALDDPRLDETPGGAAAT